MNHERGYGIIDFDVWPESGDVLELVDGDGRTARVEVTGRRRGGYFIVNLLDGRPQRGDHVAVTERKENEDEHE